MKTNPFTTAALIAAACLSPNLWAQQPEAASQPSAPNSVIYLPQVPSVAELSRNAAAKNQSIASIQVLDGVEIVAYHLPNNQLSVVEYRTLPASGAQAVAGAESAPLSATVAAPDGSAPSTTPYAAAPVVTSPAPAVVYTTPAPTYYYADASPYYYYPWGWYPAGYVGFGFGGRFGSGFRGGFGGHFGGRFGGFRR